MTIPELLQTLAGKVVNHVTCTFEQYQDITDKDSNTLYYATDRKAIFKGDIKLCDLTEIGDLRNLETSNSTNLVSAINEVNQKAINNQGEGVVHDSTITPFVGFLPTGVTVIERSSASTNGEVLYDAGNNRFVWKDLSGTFVEFYANWLTSYLYNDTSDSTVSAKSNKLFSYNDAHYMVINGTLQDISNIESTLKAYADRAATAVRNYATSQANSALNLAKTHSDNNLNVAKTYTDTQITAKIQLVPELPSEPVEGVLYLIPDE